MNFRPRNAYYLRISTNIILPLFLYLDERHIDWMSDMVLQHVLADLRSLIIPKLQAEKDVHFSPGAAHGNKRGTVEVHRGETYQFAYFFRKTEPHTVLSKSRHFVTAPLRPEASPRPALPRLADPSRQNGTGARVSSEQSKRKRARGKTEDPQSPDEDEWSVEESEEDTDNAAPTPREPRPIRKQRRIIRNKCYQDDDEILDVGQDVAMSSPPPLMDRESDENSGVSVVQGRDVTVCEAEDRPSDTADIELIVEEEERKPKPLLKLRYQSFPIAGHCLCVVVEPWPPLRAAAKLSVAQTPFQREGSTCPPNESIIIGQRSKTPLFLPEYDRAQSEAPPITEKHLPPVPSFHDIMSDAGGYDEYGDDSLMDFSQTLNAAGHIHAIAAEDGDDMDGAVLFGDADEVRELL